LTENPYVRTAFRIVKMARQVASRRTMVQRIHDARSIAQTDAESRSILGRPVTLEEINKAEAILLSAEDRILEELLVHATERPSRKRAGELARRAAEAMTPDDAPAADEQPPAAVNPKALQPLLDELAGKSLDAMGPAEAAFGAEELTVVPPFGQAGRK
jgi:hypothetical protein